MVSLLCWVGVVLLCGRWISARQRGCGHPFSFTGFAGFAVGIPFAIGGLWTAVSKRRGMLQSQLSTIWELAISSSTRWKFAAGLNGAYLLLLVAYFVMASW